MPDTTTAEGEESEDVPLEEEDHVGGVVAKTRTVDSSAGLGKFKQMTGRQELDTDSGFSDSMVRSEEVNYHWQTTKEGGC